MTYSESCAKIIEIIESLLDRDEKVYVLQTFITNIELGETPKMCYVEAKRSKSEMDKYNEA